MASFIAVEAPESGPGAPDEKMEFVRDGFSLWAFLFPFIWLLWHRLWIEAVVVIAAGAVTGLVGSVPGYEFLGSALAFLISLYVGLEGNNMRIAGLRRRGWIQTSVLEASSSADAALKYFAEAPRASSPVSAAPGPQDRSAAPARLAGGGRPAGPALGFLSLPDGR